MRNLNEMINTMETVMNGLATKMTEFIEDKVLEVEEIEEQINAKREEINDILRKQKEVEQLLDAFEILKGYEIELKEQLTELMEVEGRAEEELSELIQIKNRNKYGKYIASIVTEKENK